MSKIVEVMDICDDMVEKEIILFENICVLKRPLYWGKYFFTVGLSPTAQYWLDFPYLKKVLLSLKNGDDFLQSNSKTIDFWFFSNTPHLLEKLIPVEEYFFFNHINIIDKKSWHLKLPKPKIKTKWYDEYSWRIEFTNKKWLLEQDNLDRLEILSDPYRFITFPGSFLYLTTLQDTIAIKLMWAEHIRNIEDRSDL